MCERLGGGDAVCFRSDTKSGAFGNTANTLSLITNGYNFGRGGCSSTRSTFSRADTGFSNSGGLGGGGGVGLRPAIQWRREGAFIPGARLRGRRNRREIITYRVNELMNAMGRYRVQL